MLVRQQTASHNPLLSSSSDNASSTPPLRLLPSSTSSPSHPPLNNRRKLLNQLFRCLAWTDTHMLLELTRCTAGVNLSFHRFLVWCMNVSVQMCEEWSILKVRECLSVLRCICLRPRGAVIVTYWPLNALCFPFVAPQTPGRRRVQVSGCCSAVPGCTGGSYKGFFFFFFWWGGRRERNLYASSFLDKLFIDEQFTLHQNVSTLHENETKMGWNDILAAGFLTGFQRKNVGQKVKNSKKKQIENRLNSSCVNINLSALLKCVIK